VTLFAPWKRFSATPPAEDRPQPAEDRPQPAEDRPQPAEDRPQPAEDRPQPAEDRPRPAPDSLQPAEHGAKPAEDRPQPAEDLSLTSITRPESRYDGNPSDQLKTVFSEWDLEFGECFTNPQWLTTRLNCDGTFVRELHHGDPEDESSLKKNDKNLISINPCGSSDCKVCEGAELCHDDYHDDVEVYNFDFDFDF
jgi:hypothetical protein